MFKTWRRKRLFHGVPRIPQSKTPPAIRPDATDGALIGRVALMQRDVRHRGVEIHRAHRIAADLLAKIMRREVDPLDQARKWLGAYAPQHLFPKND